MARLHLPLARAMALDRGWARCLANGVGWGLSVDEALDKR